MLSASVPLLIISYYHGGPLFLMMAMSVEGTPFCFRGWVRVRYHADASMLLKHEAAQITTLPFIFRVRHHELCTLVSRYPGSLKNSPRSRAGCRYLTRRVPHVPEAQEGQLPSPTWPSRGTPTRTLPHRSGRCCFQAVR
jgi:hypothetical protein